MADIHKRSFRYILKGHNKFWTVQTRGRFYFATWGRIGTPGQTQTKELSSPSECYKAALKMIDEKVSKGYAECDSSLSPGAPDNVLTVAGGGATASPPVAVSDTEQILQRTIDI